MPLLREGNFAGMRHQHQPVVGMAVKGKGNQVQVLSYSSSQFDGIDQCNPLDTFRCMIHKQAAVQHTDTRHYESSKRYLKSWIVGRIINTN
jgi:hypothetical protein